VQLVEALIDEVAWQAPRFFGSAVLSAITNIFHDTTQFFCDIDVKTGVNSYFKGLLSVFSNYVALWANPKSKIYSMGSSLLREQVLSKVKSHSATVDTHGSIEEKMPESFGPEGY